MIDIPASSFVQGCIFFGDEGCPFDAMPNESISLSAYRIDRHEVTQEDYEVCVQMGPCTAPAGDYDPAGAPRIPVANVTHGQAAAFCGWLGRRLPTESEWERAARGTDQRTYPWGEDTPSCVRAQKDGCDGDRINVESLPEGRSPVLAFDMAGNVSEWVADWYNPAYYPTADNVDPPGPASGTERVVRGGSQASGDDDLTTWRRDRARPDETDENRGFRCAQ
jgi:formylglycine-generating enzyme required for sulfatase activity